MMMMMMMMVVVVVVDRYDYDGLTLKCVARDSFNVLPQHTSTIIINLDPCQFTAYTQCASLK